MRLRAIYRERKVIQLKEKSLNARYRNLRCPTSFMHFAPLCHVYAVSLWHAIFYRSVKDPKLHYLRDVREVTWRSKHVPWVEV